MMKNRTETSTLRGRHNTVGDWRSRNFIPLPIIEACASDALALFAKRCGGEASLRLDAELLVREMFQLEVFCDNGGVMDGMGTDLLGCLFADGMLCPATGGDRVIMVNDAPRFRSVTTAFTILHELGHYLFHHPTDAVAPVSPSYCRSTDVQATGKNRVPPREWQASRFASEVLMPKENVVWLLDGKRPPEIINLEIYGPRFREFFRVSQAAMEKRLFDLGYNCAFGRYAYANVTQV